MDILSIILIAIIFVGLYYYIFLNKKKERVHDNDFITSEDIDSPNFDSETESFNDIINSESTKTYFNIKIGGKPVGKIIMRLFDNIVPLTSKNFAELCRRKKYKNTIIHRIINNKLIQGGDTDYANGRGGSSIYGKKFDDENFELKHDKPGLLSMANSGPNTNGSQFFITLSSLPTLDNKHVVFGEVIEGFNVLQKLNDVRTVSETPSTRCIITDCGTMN